MVSSFYNSSWTQKLLHFNKYFWKPRNINQVIVINSRYFFFKLFKKLLKLKLFLKIKKFQLSDFPQIRPILFTDPILDSIRYILINLFFHKNLIIIEHSIIKWKGSDKE